MRLRRFFRFSPAPPPTKRLHSHQGTCYIGGRELFGKGTGYAACHNDIEAPINTDNHGVMFLNSHIGQRDVADGTTHTIYVGEKRCEAEDLGWMSGTRGTLRNTGTTPNAAPGDQTGDLFVGGFGSDHTGSTNFLFGDGRVKPIFDHVDAKVFQQLGNRSDGQLLESGPTRSE